jgi:hypothetical protein
MAHRALWLVHADLRPALLTLCIAALPAAWRGYLAPGPARAWGIQEAAWALASGLVSVWTLS